MPENEYGINSELINEFVDESTDMLNNAANLFVSLEADPGNKTAIDTIFRAVHTIKGNSAFFNFLKIKFLAHALEDLMNLVRNGAVIASGAVIDTLIEGIDELKNMLARVRSGGQEVEDAGFYEKLVETVRSCVEEGRKRDVVGIINALGKDISELSGRLNPEDVMLKELIARINTGFSVLSTEKSSSDKLKDTHQGEKKAQAPGEEKSVSSSKTMRVAEEKIDVFLDFVGELVIIAELYGHISERFTDSMSNHKACDDFRKNNESFNLVLGNLVNSILQMRQVPMRSLLQRAPRIVRDVAQAKGKQIKVVSQGDDILVDKSIYESLEGPFVHILRNAADHGIEVPELREKSGKSAEGLIDISVRQDDEHIFFSFRDDGSGIDTEAVKVKAVSEGIISGDRVAQLTEQEAYQLLFMPGFSTAKEVSDISGRGVGMDVVKKQVEDIGGKIIIESLSGKGSCFTLQIPKSVSIKVIKGFLILVDGSRYILPMNMVGESFEIASKDVILLPSGGECVLRQERLYVLIRLRDILKDGKSSGRNERGVGVEVISGNKAAVILVDEVLGIQKVVVKEISGMNKGCGLVSGAALLGDESIAVVLNPERLEVFKNGGV